MTVAEAPRGEPTVAAARQVLLLLIFSLAFMKPELRLFGLGAVPTDLIYLVLLGLSVAAVATGSMRLRWRPGFGLLLLYFAAMALSVAVSTDTLRSGVKLATQVYLLSLPVLVSTLIDNEKDLRRAILAWLAGTWVVAAAGIATILFFYVDRDNPLLDHMLNIYGTLAAGPYPRLRLTFVYANLLCNYLTVSLMLLLVARHLRWIGRRYFLALLAGLLLSALFTLSPGLGGLIPAIGLWLWLLLRVNRPVLARLSLAAGITGATLFLGAMMITPHLHSTAPFLVHIPILDLTLAPAVRLLVWMDGARNFLAAPLFGRGIGMDSVHVPFRIPAGDLAQLTDAHNTYLNIAVQCGIVGLAALLLLLLFVCRRMPPLRLRADNRTTLRLVLGLAFLDVLALQGVGGSFEDARHVWVLFGLFLAAARLEEAGSGTRDPAERAMPMKRVAPLHRGR